MCVLTYAFQFEFPLVLAYAFHFDFPLVLTRVLYFEFPLVLTYAFHFKFPHEFPPSASARATKSFQQFPAKCDWSKDIPRKISLVAVRKLKYKRKSLPAIRERPFLFWTTRHFSRNSVTVAEWRRLLDDTRALALLKCAKLRHEQINAYSDFSLFKKLSCTVISNSLITLNFEIVLTLWTFSLNIYKSDDNKLCVNSRAALRTLFENHCSFTSVSDQNKFLVNFLPFTEPLSCAY